MISHSRTFGKVGQFFFQIFFNTAPRLSKSVASLEDGSVGDKNDINNFVKPEI